MNQKTPEYRELSGASDRKSRAKASETVAGTPRPPSWLSKSARGEFKRIVRHLQERGTVSSADGAYLAVYAIAYSRLIEAQKDLDAKGLRVTVTVLDSHGKAVEVTRDNPALKLVQQSEKTVLSFLRQAGLTPASRERVKPAKPRNDEEEDPMSSANIARLIEDVGRT
jgi:P27 family predicted phage terminase small subunit